MTILVNGGSGVVGCALLERLATNPARLLPVPAALLKGAATLAGKGALSRRLCGSLQVDSRKTREVLGWKPPLDIDQALRATAIHFLKEQDK